MQEYTNGTIVRLYAKFRTRDSNGDPTTLATPSSKTFRYVDPDGNVTSNTTPATASTGILYVDVTTDQIGIWRYTVNGDGSIVSGEFRVKASP